MDGVLVWGRQGCACYGENMESTDDDMPDIEKMGGGLLLLWSGSKQV